MENKPYYALLMETNKSLNPLTRLTVLKITNYIVGGPKKRIYTFDYIDGLGRSYPFDRMLERGQVFSIINPNCSQSVLAIDRVSPINALPKLYNNSICEIKDTIQYALKIIREALKRVYLDNDTLGVYIDMFQTHLVQLRYCRTDGTISATRTIYQYQQ